MEYRSFGSIHTTLFDYHWSDLVDVLAIVSSHDDHAGHACYGALAEPLPMGIERKAAAPAVSAGPFHTTE